MATEHSPLQTEAELLYRYLGTRIGSGDREAPISDLLAEFAEYRQQLDKLQASICEAIVQSDQRESRPLDLDALFARVDKRLEKEGIPE